MSLSLQANVSRLGKEARAARRDQKGSTRSAVSAPCSEAGSEEEPDSGHHEDDQADPNKAEGVSGRRKRQASVQSESAWLESEETPSKHKSRRKASCSSPAPHTTSMLQTCDHILSSCFSVQLSCKHVCLMSLHVSMPASLHASCNRQCCMQLLVLSPGPRTLP